MVAENSERWVISVCGLNCVKCDMHLACHVDEKLRDEIIEWFRDERGETVRPEQIVCEGCRGPLGRHWSSDCRMMLCAKDRGLQYCFECGDFPCTFIDEFSSDGISHHKRTIENSKRMRELGIEAWIAEQEREGRCVFCP